MSKISFLGLGQMGTPMARRLLLAGHDLTVWNRTAARVTPLVLEGAKASAAEAATGADFAITMLATSQAVEQVLFGPDGLAAALVPGQILIEMSTIGPRAFGSIASRLPEGVAAVDAPVLGSIPQASEEKLSVFVGATGTEFERVRPVLASLGEVRHVGEPGAGAALKLVVNLTLGAAMVAFGEAMALAKALRLDRAIVLDVLTGSPIGSTVTKLMQKRDKLETHRFPPNFKLRHAAKDLRLVEEAARAGGLDLLGAQAAVQWLDAAMKRGLADLDYSAVVAAILDEEAVQS